MADRRRIRPEGGFILAEVLATLAISGLVVLTLATGIGMLIQSWERTSGRFNRMEALIRALAVLRRDLQGLQFATWTPEEEPELIFSGTVDTIAFVPGRNVAAPTPADYVVRIQAIKRGGRNLIVRTSAPISLARAISGTWTSPIRSCWSVAPGSIGSLMREQAVSVACGSILGTARGACPRRSGCKS